jgi:outer membrane protein assembly factor BamB
MREVRYNDQLYMKYLLFILAAILSLAGCSQRCEVEWKFKAGGSMENSPVIFDDKLIIGVSDENLYALDLKEGTVLWKKDLGGRVFMTPLVDGRHIYAGSLEGDLHKIRPEDGSTEWEFQTPGLEFDPCADSEGIYFGAGDGYLYKIDRQGKLLWKFQTGDKLTSSCTFYNDLVITTSWDKHLYAIRRDTGAEVWKLPTNQFNYGNAIVAGNSIFYGTHHKIYRVEPTTGKLIFEKDTAYNDHMVAWQNFIFTQENGLTKRSLEGGVIQNLTFIPQTQFRPSIAGDSIVMSDTTNHVYGISPNMEIQWKFRAKDNFWAPGVLHEGIYYIGNRDHYVYALRLPS